MRAITFFILLIIGLIVEVKGQTAPNFNTNDCNGNPHDLYTELAQGKVIVLDWVMPCSSCIGPSKTAYNIVQSYSSSKVLFYLLDDQGNTSCTTLSGWASNSGIGPNRTTFSTTSISETNYGGTGMPHIAIVGNNGKIYFNQFNGNAGDATGIQNAINSALSETAVNEPAAPAFTFSVSPNPSCGKILLNYTLPEPGSVAIEILNLTGQKVAAFGPAWKNAGSQEEQLDLRNLAAGCYLIRFGDGRNIHTEKLIISR